MRTLSVRVTPAFLLDLDHKTKLTFTGFVHVALYSGVARAVYNASRGYMPDPLYKVIFEPGAALMPYRVQLDDRAIDSWWEVVKAATKETRVITNDALLFALGAHLRMIGFTSGEGWRVALYDPAAQDAYIQEGLL